jgi:pentatricopeptide repeat domain-containing protein 1
LSEVKKPEDKLLLLGGLTGFLDTMKQFGVKPDLKTYTELIEVIPPTTALKKRLLNLLKKHEIKCDVDFFNVLMKKRAMRFDYNGSREVLDLIDKVNLEPDIVTYGVLALCCQTHDEAKALMEEMEHKDIKMNIQILGAMLKTGCVRKDFDYIIDILHCIKDLNLKPNDRVLESLQIFIKACNYHKRRDQRNTEKDFRKDFSNFKVRLENWKKEVGLNGLELDEAKKILKDAPWEQFQTTQADGFETPKGQEIKKLKKLKRYIGKIKEKDLKVE